jgi:predicted nucleotidyltransferase component of viral defense system
LYSIYETVSDELVLKGGTCLYKIYGLNRFSEDLDFTQNKRKFDAIKEIRKIIPKLRMLEISAEIKREKRYKNQINILLAVKGPLYVGKPENICFIPLNIGLREKVLLKPRMEIVKSFYREFPSFNVCAMDENEILVEKIRACIARDEPRDLYDLWFLLCKKKLPIRFDILNKKLKKSKLKFDLRSLENKIENVRAKWDNLKALVMGELPQFDEVKSEIQKEIRNK